jgi:hypothetical protein
MSARALVSVLVGTGIMLACSVPAEQPIISDFFAASRLRDTTALSRFSTIVFEPREQGTVPAFHIRSVSPDTAAGNMLIRDVTVLATVRSPAGSVVEKSLVVRLQRPATSDQRQLYGGWIVTGVTDAPVPARRPE